MVEPAGCRGPDSSALGNKNLPLEVLWMLPGKPVACKYELLSFGSFMNYFGVCGLLFQGCHGSETSEAYSTQAGDGIETVGLDASPASLVGSVSGLRKTLYIRSCRPLVSYGPEGILTQDTRAVLGTFLLPSCAHG